MAARTGLELRQGQSQSLVMTPQLQQSIKLLQMSSLELSEFLDTQLLDNPLLQRPDGDGDASETAEAEPAADTGQREALTSDVVQWQESHGMENKDAGLDIEDSSNWKESVAVGDAEQAGYWDMGGGARDGGFSNPGDVVEQTVATEVTLQEHLREQLRMEAWNPAEKFIADYLIDLLDEAGYIRESLAQAAQSLGCSEEEVEAVLKQLQGFDPAGVFARDLKECLKLQLQERDRFDPAMAKLIQNLEWVADGEFNRLQRVCGVSQEDLLDMLQELKALHPKPGYQFDHEMTEAIRPDILVQQDAQAHWHVELHSHSLPKVLVNQRYHSQLKEKSANETERKFLTEKLQHANWLVKALDQRANTILRVATEIVSQQSMFLKHGVRYLKPLTLKMVAEKLSLHESTISRVTANKYMETPRGVFELKYFFTSSLSYDGMGGELSSEAVKSQIRDLIESETQDTILSDDAIADILKERGISIARRTVAKYREAMHLGSSAERRRAMKIKL